MEKPLNIAAFLDHRPGHIKQTLGVLDAMQRLTPVNIIKQQVQHLSLAEDCVNWLKYFLLPTKDSFSNLRKSAGIGRILSPRHNLNITTAAKQYNHNQAVADNFDLIIGTGSHTHMQMLYWKKKLQVPVITCMSPSPLIIKRFDLCFIPYHDGKKERGNVLLTNGPPNRSRAKGRQHSDRALILIGGTDNKSHYWRSNELSRQIASLISNSREIKWTIASSPRTPDKTITKLKTTAAEHNNCKFIPFADTKPGWIEEQYDISNIVWVTSDSMSMVYEALSAGCHVGLLPVRWKKNSCKFQYSETILRQNGYVTTFADWQLNKTFTNRPQLLNEAERCAREILKRWWPNRLQ